MTLILAPEIETLVVENAQQQGTTPVELIENLVRDNFAPKQRQAIRGIVPQDDWEERVLSAITDCGVSLSNEAVSSEGLYD